MVEVTPCKINLGLNILGLRSDGYHEISTIMYPIRALADVVELQKSQAADNEFSQSGLVVECPPSQNICMRALRLMQLRYGVGCGRIHLHKQVPMGAGLGGGSANGVAVMSMCNKMWSLGLNETQMESLAAEIGSDTPFFVHPRPTWAQGRGERLTTVELCLEGYYIYMVKPDIGVSTAQAYAGITTHQNGPESVAQIVSRPVEQWRGRLKNDFEESVFARLPLLGLLKEQLYASGAIYSSLSGSGSTVYGLFREPPVGLHFPYFTHTERL
ncbi:MAG: 4-(cytidine 5'-diphospho)-2-C-methyl-D-erythritol kinase [Mucinivorans sp.]